jgi:N-acetylmuramoyl-L-alanine amidase
MMDRMTARQLTSYAAGRAGRSAVVIPVAALVTSLCLLAAAAGTAAPAPPPITHMRPSVNKTLVHVAHRRINRIVIHSTEGGLRGSTRWLQVRRSKTSAHYVISRAGRIYQLVRLADIAWHAGNRRVNAHSIGIEHVGFAGDSRGFTAPEYRASARLVAWLCLRYRIPVDRRHIIGHADVPDPRHPGLFGGRSHHSDPGQFWRWGHYLRLVRHDVELLLPPRLEWSSLHAGQRLIGRRTWRVVASAPVRRVEFWIDGRLRWTDRRRPFTFASKRGLATTALPNGPHRLLIRALTADGRSALGAATVDVYNPVYRLTTGGARRWSRAHGVLRLRVRAWGAPSRLVRLWIDGSHAAVDRRAPFVFRWNTRLRRDGRHNLLVEAIARDGRHAVRRIPVVVSNHVK